MLIAGGVNLRDKNNETYITPKELNVNSRLSEHQGNVARNLFRELLKKNQKGDNSHCRLFFLSK